MPRRNKTSFIEDILFLLFSPLARRKQAERALRSLRFRKFVDVSPTEFEQATGELFRQKGFEVTHSGKTGDGGVDLTMTKGGLKFIAQCKRYTTEPIGEPILRDFYGALVHQRADHGYFVTTSRFTKPAIDFAKNKPITLVDGIGIQNWLDQIEKELESKGLVGRPINKQSRMTTSQIVLLSILAIITCVTCGVAGFVWLNPPLGNEAVSFPTSQPLPTNFIMPTSPAQVPVEWQDNYVDLYAVVIKIPVDWTISEINRRPEPQTNFDPKQGHDCADYLITNQEETAKLFIRPTCGFGEGIGRPWPLNTVIIDQRDSTFFLRYFDEERNAYFYSTGGYVTISDSNGTRQEAYLPDPPDMMFGKSHAEIEFRYSISASIELSAILQIADEIVLSLNQAK
ncbi:MAG: restriction endonuclease [Chloroflexota bacterium]